MKDTHNHCPGQHRASAMQGLTRRILVRLCLGVLVMCGITFGSVPVLADDEAIVVPRDFPTIQAAVDAAPSGATIKVSPGTYTEEIVITRDLRVEGAGVGATILQSPATLTPFAVFVSNVPTETPLGAVVRITNGAKVRMFGFTVTGPVPCAVEAQGIVVVEGARLTLAESHITRMRPEPADPSTCNPGNGIRIGFPAAFRIGSQFGSTGHGKITDVIIDRYQGDGIGVGGPPGGAASTATISHTVILEGTGVTNTSQGIAIRQNAVARVTENIVAGNVCTAPFCGPDPLNDFQSAGIVAFDVSPSSVEILDNHIFANEIGIAQVASPHCCTISANRVSNNRFFGIVIADGDGTTSGNTITGGRVGIGVIATTVDTVGVLQGDRIRRASMAPVQELECCGFTATAIVAQRPKQYGQDRIK
ncbi:MAG: right-handed parallel beta-helix repeat-containing protein [Gammaproteobacteria bacterium]